MPRRKSAANAAPAAAKKARATPAVAAPSVVPAAPIAAQAIEQMPAAHRENPEKLDGDALRQLAHRRGIARSEIDRLMQRPDGAARLREQLRYRAYAQYETENA